MSVLQRLDLVGAVRLGGRRLLAWLMALARRWGARARRAMPLAPDALDARVGAMGNVSTGATHFSGASVGGGWGGAVSFTNIVPCCWDAAPRTTFGLGNNGAAAWVASDPPDVGPDGAAPVAATLRPRSGGPGAAAHAHPDLGGTLSGGASRVCLVGRSV